MKKKIKPKNPEIKSKPEIELATEIIKKTEVKPPDSLNTMNKPKRHYSITPISYQLEKVKSKVFNTKNTLPKEEKVKSETLILYASPFPIIRTSIQRNEQFNFQKNLIKPNNKVLFI